MVFRLFLIMGLVSAVSLYSMEENPLGIMPRDVWTVAFLSSDNMVSYQAFLRGAENVQVTKNITNNTYQIDFGMYPGSAEECFSKLEAYYAEVLRTGVFPPLTLE